MLEEKQKSFHKETHINEVVRTTSVHRSVLSCNSFIFLFCTFFNIPFRFWTRSNVLNHITVHLVLLQAEAVVRVEFFYGYWHHDWHAVLVSDTRWHCCMFWRTTWHFSVKLIQLTCWLYYYRFIRYSLSCHTFLLSFGAQRHFIHEQMFAGIFLFKWRRLTWWLIGLGMLGHLSVLVLCQTLFPFQIVFPPWLS